MKVLYNVTTKIANGVYEEWLQWMKEVHIPEVMMTGMFEECRFSRMLGEDESEGKTYAVQYLAKSMAHFQTYQENHAAPLRKAYKDKYEGKYMVFRSLLGVEEVYTMKK